MPRELVSEWAVAEVNPIVPTSGVRYPVPLAPGLTLAAGQLIGPVGTTQNQAWTLTVTGTITAGTFTLTPQHPAYGAADPITLDFDVANADLQAALEGVYGAGNVAVTGTALPTGPVTITLQGALAGMAAAEPTIGNADLTGGTLAAAEATAGQMADSYVAASASVEAKAVLPFAVATDDRGRAYMGDSTDPRLGTLMPTVTAWFAGIFRTVDLVGLDADRAAELGKVIKGTLADGYIHVGVGGA